jgi:large subunit ribosomal protein L10
MNKAEKQQIVDFLGEQFRSIDSAFLIDYQGLKVVEATDLRRKIREIDGHYVVVKNTLAMLAAKETILEQLESHFQGPTAIAYHSKDVVGLAKLLTEINKLHPSFKFKAALVEGRVVQADEIKTIASMPSREMMLSNLLALLLSPLQSLHAVLKAPVRDLCLVLKQIKK